MVLDASVVVEWLLRLPRADAVEERLRADTSWHAPHLLGVEVTQVVRRGVLRGDMSAARGREALEALIDLDVTRYPHEPLLGLAWELRENITAYDAVYVALAMALECPLLTLDARLAAATPAGARVDLLG